MHNLTAIITGCLLLALLVAENRHQPTGRTEVDVVERQSITFIMGEDRTEQQYYSLAADYFAMDPAEKTDIVIRTCRTLSDVIEYLNTSSIRSGVTWSVINIVAHGNPQTGLNLYITEKGHKATPKRLLQAALRGDTPVIAMGAVDSMTQINFWSCGIGTSAMMQVALRQIFKPEGRDAARIHCSTDFVIFHPSLTGIAPRRITASYWPYFFQRGYRPSDSEISQALRNQFPDENIVWSSALKLQDLIQRCCGDDGRATR